LRWNGIVMESKCAPVLCRYRCIHCLTPCDSLYRTYGSSTIKLSQCSNCQRDVDPYCEREWLLIVLDCIALREEAYRHVLMHRIADLDLESNLYRNGILMICSSLLRSYILSNTQKDPTFHINGAQTTHLPFCEIILTCLIQLFTSVALVYCFLLTLQNCNLLLVPICRDNDPASTAMVAAKSDRIYAPSLMAQAYAAILLPTACQVITILVQLWEDSDTVLQLGSLLIFSYQWMSLTILIRILLFVNISGDGKRNKTIHLPPLAATLLLGLVLCSRAVVLAGYERLMLHADPIPCPGLALNLTVLLPWKVSFCLA